MKKTTGIVCVVIFLFVGLSITPAIGSIQKADMINLSEIRYCFETEELVTIEFVDCTGGIPVKTEVKLSQSEWTSLRNELNIIRQSSESIEESLHEQFSVLKKYNVISDDFSSGTMLSRRIEKLNSISTPRFLNRMGITPVINNSVFNAMCAIDFELTNGTTLVFGLNTFVNYIGFDIISVHQGYAINGIDTKGLLTSSTPPGEYVGSMFGFLGYWLGEKTSTGVYSDVTVAGFTVFTFWLPIPMFP